MKRVIAFEHEAKKKRSKFFDEKKRKRERERGKRSRAQRKVHRHRALSRFKGSSLFIVVIIIAQSPLFSLSIARAPTTKRKSPKTFHPTLSYKKKILTSVARTNYPCLRRATRALARTCGRRNRNSARAPVSSRTFATTSLSSLLY